MPVQHESEGARQYVLPSGGSTPLQIVRWSGQRVGASFAASSVRVTIPDSAYLIELAATENCYINFGDNTVDATATIASDASRLFLAGVQIVPVPLDPATGNPYTHVAVIQESAAGILQVEKVN